MNATASQTWDPEQYAANARFVADLGMPALQLLAPCAGERILDVGCGDGALTAKIADLGCEVVGVDASAEQIAAAKKLGLDARVGDAEHLFFNDEFDAVFSNAALHWMRNPDLVIAGARRALRPTGRFVGEFGGYGCVEKIKTALVKALISRGLDGESANPWYFPGAEEYADRLTTGGFAVQYIALIPRPTPLPGDLIGWLQTFGQSFANMLPPGQRLSYFEEVRDMLCVNLCDSNGHWIADYVRLRFSAVRGS
ncbi:MAG: class I SAM-dependent methyltransferase [Candidatus Acidiferrum sp.]